VLLRCRVLLVSVTVLFGTYSMTDSDRVSVVCDVNFDYLVQKSKNSRPRKNTRLVLDRDDWGDIILVVLSKSNKMRFKLEKNILQVYTDNKSQGKMSIELSLPQVVILLSSPASVIDFLAFVDIVQRLFDDPASADSIELFKGEEDDYEPVLKKRKASRRSEEV